MGLSRNPMHLKLYLERAKKFEHWKVTYNIGYENYVRDLLNLATADQDKYDIHNENVLKKYMPDVSGGTD